MQLRLKRVESGLHQKTMGILLGGATQGLISWWESGRYMPGDLYPAVGFTPPCQPRCPTFRGNGLLCIS
jgi:hypothetical protein